MMFLWVILGVALVCGLIGFITGYAEAEERAARRYADLHARHALAKIEANRSADSPAPAVMLPITANWVYQSASVAHDIISAAPEPAPALPPARTWTDAASIMPVTLPAPPRLLGTVQLLAPQASRWPADNTGLLGKVTNTGELRAATDAGIERMRAENAAWLQQWAEGAPA